MACARARIESREVLHYLDDFLFGGSNAGECQSIVDIFIDVCKVLGVPIAWGKSEGPQKVITFLGLGNAGQITEKVREIRTIIHDMLRKSKPT